MILQKKDISGVMVLYNPPENVVEMINSFLSQIAKLYIIDNSEFQNRNIVDEINLLDNVDYKWNGGNEGISFALNQGATMACEQKYQYLLLMDQDTKLSPLMIKEYIEFLNSNTIEEPIGILAPFYQYAEFIRSNPKKNYTSIETAFTSGTMLNLEAYKKNGGFEDKLFIDYVDIEYSLRLRQNGYKIFQINTINCLHQLGNIKTKKILFRKIAVTNHSALRYYYRTRNRLYVYKKYYRIYPLWVINDIYSFVIKEIPKIIIYENNKLEKMLNITFGFFDFIRSKTGKVK